MHHRYMHAQCLLDTVVYAAYGCRTLVHVGPKLGLFALLSFPLFVLPFCLFVFFRFFPLFVFFVFSSFRLLVFSTFCLFHFLSRLFVLVFLSWSFCLHLFAFSSVHLFFCLFARGARIRLTSVQLRKCCLMLFAEIPSLTHAHRGLNNPSDYQPRLLNIKS